jgi:hypothetical protein
MIRSTTMLARVLSAWKEEKISSIVFIPSPLGWTCELHPINYMYLSMEKSNPNNKIK